MIRKLDNSDQQNWDAFVTLGVKLVTAHRWKAYRDLQRRFVRLVDGFMRKYGQHPRLLATRADMMERNSAKVPYLVKAYRGAIRTNDKEEMVLTAHSLAEIFLESRQIDKARLWIGRLKANLLNHRDRTWAKDCREMEKQLREM